MLFAAGPLARGPERPRLSSELSSSAARHLAATRRNHNGKRGAPNFVVRRCIERGV